jgi:thiol-disulfide isomerase/thioredoxin
LGLCINLACFAQHLGKPVNNPAEITRTAMNLLFYQQKYLRLAQDFTAFDTKGKLTSKLHFLQKLATGNYLPLKLRTTDGTEQYRLQKLDAGVGQDIKSIIAQFADNYLKHYQMEGTSFPTYRYVDLNGRIYTPQNMRGKILVLKSWFIRCQACNEEMPELNQMVQQYRNRKDIVFVSIAFDAATDLRRFLKTKPFYYAVVPVREKYIEETLHTNAYPTHWVVNQQGKIIKVVNDASELRFALQQAAKQTPVR